MPDLAPLDLRPLALQLALMLPHLGPLDLQMPLLLLDMSPLGVQLAPLLQLAHLLMRRGVDTVLLEPLDAPASALVGLVLESGRTISLRLLDALHVGLRRAVGSLALLVLVLLTAFVVVVLVLVLGECGRAGQQAKHNH